MRRAYQPDSEIPMTRQATWTGVPSATITSAAESRLWVRCLLEQLDRPPSRFHLVSRSAICLRAAASSAFSPLVSPHVRPRSIRSCRRQRVDRLFTDAQVMCDLGD